MVRPIGIDPREQAERDAAMWAAWVTGTRQVDLAERYQITQQSVSEALGRFAMTLPEPDRLAHRQRVLAWLEEIAAAYVPKLSERDPEAARIILTLVGRLAKALGLDAPTTVLAAISGRTDAAGLKGPREHLADVLERWRLQDATKVTPNGDHP